MEYVNYKTYLLKASEFIIRGIKTGSLESKDLVVCLRNDEVLYWRQISIISDLHYKCLPSAII